MKKIRELVCKLSGIETVAATMRKPEPQNVFPVKEEKPTGTKPGPPKPASRTKFINHCPSVASMSSEESHSSAEGCADDSTIVESKSTVKQEKSPAPQAVQPIQENRVVTTSHVEPVAKAQTPSKQDDFKSTTVSRPDYSPIFISTAKTSSSMDTCVDEGSYTMFSDVTSAFLPVPQQQKPGTLAQLRPLKEDETQSERSPSSLLPESGLKTPTDAFTPPKPKPRNRGKNVALWERVISPGMTPIRYCYCFLYFSHDCACLARTTYSSLENLGNMTATKRRKEA